MGLMGEVAAQLHSILGRILAPLPGRRGSDRDADPDASMGGIAKTGAASSANIGTGAGGANTGTSTTGACIGTGGAAAAERRDRYTLYALQCLVEAARKYETAAEPVRWGWCRCAPSSFDICFRNKDWRTGARFQDCLCVCPSVASCSFSFGSSVKSATRWLMSWSQWDRLQVR